MNNWMLLRGEKKIGPLSTAQIIQAIKKRSISQTDVLIDLSNETKKMRAFSIQDFTVAFEEVLNEDEMDSALNEQPALNKPNPRKSKEIDSESSDVKKFASNKVIAGILGILFGGLGIHKFILGISGPGAIMLVCSIAGASLFCFLIPLALPIIMSTIGFIEGIIYLCTKDDDFYKKYSVNKQGWF
jgi:TM2 domain-containing membrane protein YozV